MDSIRYAPNDAPLLDKPKHIGMVHSIHITHTLLGTDTDTYFIIIVTASFSCVISLEPVIEEFPDDTTAVEGEGVFFKVVVSGKPEPTLTWYHNEEEITPNYSQEIERDGSLSIPSTEVKHRGTYRLIARNSLGSAEQEVKLSVHKSMDFIPIPVKDFGKYVAKNHNNNNQGFKEQFQVSNNCIPFRSKGQ